ncbi:MAG: hypothetical protein ACLT1J_08270 [Mediterraneibacter gnavus]
MNFGEYARAFFKHALECKTSETVLPGCANQRKQMVNKREQIEKMGNKKISCWKKISEIRYAFPAGNLFSFIN